MVESQLRDRLLSDAATAPLFGGNDLSDAALKRFLAARGGNVDAAFELAQSVVRWRKDHKVDLILGKEQEFVAQDRWGMAYWHGVDLKGRPILVIRGSRHDPALFTTETTVRYLIWKIESKLLQANVDQIVLIFDFLNVSIRHNLDFKLMRIMNSLLQSFYPERLGVCLVYPTSQFMWAFLKVFSKTMDDRTQEKFLFVREQKRDNKFLKLIAPDQLQTRFGGTCMQEFGVEGLGMIPEESIKSELKIVSDTEECVGPAAFQEFTEFDVEEFHEQLSEERRGSLFEEDEQFQSFMDTREKEVDRFQLKLQYQVSHYGDLEAGSEGSDETELSLDSDVTRKSDFAAKVSDVSGTPDQLVSSVRSSRSCSESGKRMGKRQFVKRFFRRHIQRKKTQLEDVSIDSSIEHKEENRRSSKVEFIGDEISSKDTEMEKRKRRLNATYFSESSHAFMDKVKFVMEAGASTKKVLRENPGNDFNTWSSCEGSRFDCRIGPDYKSKKGKAPSGAAIYDTVCCDVWKVQQKRPHIASYMQLPKEKPTSAKSDRVAPIPELLIINMMMPGYKPSGLFEKKKVDGPGQSVVVFSKLSSWAAANPEDPSVQLWSRFVNTHKTDPFRERLKMITRLENPKDVNLGRIELALLKKYNGTPWLVRPEYEFHAGDGYFEIDIDYHLFNYFVLSNAMPILDRATNAILDVALMIQAESDHEMPERCLVCVTVNSLNLKAAPEIDLVQMDRSKARPSLLNGASFIDRNGNVHTSTPHERKSVVFQDLAVPENKVTDVEIDPFWKRHNVWLAILLAVFSVFLFAFVNK